MADLNFIETLTVEQFKRQEGVDKVKVLQNGAKLFFTYGGKQGPVSDKGIPQQPMISLVHPDKETGPTDEERKFIGKSIKNADGSKSSDPKAGGYFYILHEEGKGLEPVAEF